MQTRSTREPKTIHKANLASTRPGPAPHPPSPLLRTTPPRIASRLFATIAAQWSPLSSISPTTLPCAAYAAFAFHLHPSLCLSLSLSLSLSVFLYYSLYYYFYFYFYFCFCFCYCYYYYYYYYDYYY